MNNDDELQGACFENGTCATVQHSFFTNLIINVVKLLNYLTIPFCS